MKQITIYDLLPLLKKGWVAMDKNNIWHWFILKPKTYPAFNKWMHKAQPSYDFYQFNIAPFDRNWKDSLIKVEHKEEE